MGEGQETEIPAPGELDSRMWDYSAENHLAVDWLLELSGFDFWLTMLARPLHESGRLNFRGQLLRQ